MRWLAAVLALLVSVPALAQPASPKFVGSWSGTIKQGDQDVELILNIAPADAAPMRVFMDVPSQNVRGMIVQGASVTGTSIMLPLGAAHFEGRVDAAGETIAGKVISPGGEQAFTFERTSATPVLPATEAAVEDPDGLAGDFDGSIRVGATGLDATLHLRRTADGYVATLDVPAQNAAGLVADSVSIEGESVAIVWGFGSYSGTLSADRNSLDGTWTQGGRELELDFVRTGADE
jgi:hypothetical protein